MNLSALFAPCLALLAGAACTTFSELASQATEEGLVAVRSAQLDELWRRPNTDFSSYRGVLIDPVQVEFSTDWLSPMNAYNRSVSGWSEADDGRIAAEMGASLQSILAEAFRARGYAIAAVPEPGVLRVSPRIADLYVNAPDRPSPWRTKTFTREAGQATLLLEARDAVTGAVLVRVLHRGTANQMGRLALANDVSNRFWFDSLFNRWAAGCSDAFRAGDNRP